MSGINSETFSATNTVRSYTTAASGLYKITAVGGSGGLVNTTTGLPGFASEVDGWIHLNANTQVYVAVGHSGSNVDTAATIGGAGGGGASYVYYFDQAAANPGAAPILLEVAGGGGGAAKISTGSFNGGAAQGIIADMPASPATAPLGYTGFGGGGGGDFLQAGYTLGNLVNGGIGGNGLIPNGPSMSAVPFWGGQSSYSQGGFGGGGSGDFNVGYGGGGGGYIGGAGGTASAPQGAGGSSYILPDATNTHMQAGSWASGDGFVSISLIRQDPLPLVAMAVVGTSAVTSNAVAYDTGANETAGFVARLYDSVLNRSADAAGAGYWINALDKGASKTEVANAFISSAEYRATHSSGSDATAFLQELYSNALGRTPDATGVAFWANALNSGHMTRAAVVVAVGESTEAVSHNAQLIANGVPYQQMIG